MNRQFSLTSLIQNEFRNPQNQLLKSSDFLAKLKDIEKSNEEIENLEYVVFISKEFTSDHKFNARLKRLNIRVPWPVEGLPVQRVPQDRTIHHLEQMPCKDQTEENIHEFIKNIKRFNITKSEALNMVNEPPTAPLHIQLIVEDSEERLTDDQVEEIITLSKRYLILEPKDDAEEVMPN
ncbi:unnamed protein product [Diamesa serratosioi]